MAINSIDLVTIPSRSMEASNIVGKEQHQIQNMSESGAAILEKEIADNSHRTVETKKKEKMNFDLDGSGKSFYQKGKKRKKKKEEPEDEKKAGSNSRFDITI